MWQEGVESIIQSHAAGYNPCTLLRDSAHVRQGSYFISEENVKGTSRQVGINQHWHLKVFLSIFEHEH